MSSIGQWAHRRDGKSHLIESMVADRFVMRCGREMEQYPGIGSRVLVFGVPTWTNPACSQCDGPTAELPTLNTRGEAP
jgi:hypothetical protein